MMRDLGPGRAPPGPGRRPATALRPAASWRCSRGGPRPRPARAQARGPREGPSPSQKGEGQQHRGARVAVLRSGDELTLQDEPAEQRGGIQAPAWLQKVLGPWRSLPGRYKVVVGTSLAFVICSMDKVNISIAIIPMSQEFGWNSTVSGLVQSAFFWGYMFSQIPGGYITSYLGGRKVLPLGVGLWSAATAGVPLLAGSMPGLMLGRAAVGLGEGVAPTCATDMVARIVSQGERSRAISFIFGGLHVGSLLGLLVAPYLIEHYSWTSVFYLFGVVGLIWALWWESMVAGLRQDEPEVAEKLVSRMAPAAAAEPVDSHGGHGAGPLNPDEPMPWRAFLRNKPILSLAWTHFCNNWFHYTFMAWLPTYFSETMSLSLDQAAHVSLLPPIAAMVCTAIVGPTADNLVQRGWPVARVRKACQAVATMGPALCLTAAFLLEDAVPNEVIVALVTGALGLSCFSLGGLYSNHADLSPRYAPFLLGLTNTTGAIPGIVGVTITGALLDATGSWPLALFAPSIFFFISGLAVFVKWGRADQQNLELPGANDPLWIEEKIQPWLAKLRGLLPGAKKAS